MQRGLFIAPFDELSDPRLLAELAQRAEARGWDGVFLWDHIQYTEPVVEIADCWIALAAMAQATRRLRLGVLVTPLARRRPWKLARELVTLDRLSEGRITLGLGVGGDKLGEMDGFGEQTDIRLRAGMLDEGLELLVDLMSGEPVRHAGEHYQVHSRPFLPRPVQRAGRAGIPIWLGAQWPNRRPVRRAARWDGVFPIAVDPPGLHDLLAYGFEQRPAGGGPFDVCVRDAPGADPGPWRDAGATWLLTDLGPSRGPAGLGPTPGAEAARAVVDAGPGR